MELERRYITHKVELRSEGEGEEEKPATISGYAAKFNEPADFGWYEEVINERAFDGCDMTDVAALFNHDPNIILSRTNGDSVTGLSLMVDSIGLKYEFKAMNKSAEMLANNIKLGFVTKSSYAYYVEDANWDYSKDAQGNEKERRTIMKISKVQDVSPVTFPAYNSTSVEARNFDHERTIKPTETTQDYILNLKLNRNENK